MRILLFTGKGGVGKTTLAAATAVRCASDGRDVLVVSTDPAHSLADCLGLKLGSEPTEVESDRIGRGSAGRLFGAEIDTRRLLDESWEGLREHLHLLLNAAGVSDLEAAELTRLPGVEDLLALVEAQKLASLGRWDTVVLDCGPTAETLRLLALPEAVAGYLERLFPTHRRVIHGMLAGIAGSSNTRSWDAVADAVGSLAERLSGLHRLLTGTETSVRLVATPESVVAAETRRTLTALALHRIHVDGLIANRVVPQPGADTSPAADWLRTRRAEQDEVLRAFGELGVPVHHAEYRATEPVGTNALLLLASELYGERDPLTGADRAPAMEVTGGGRSLDSRYALRIGMPLHQDAELDLARVGDDLAVTVDGNRRLITLPAVLRRCIVTDAVAGDDGVTVTFRPDPDQWMR